MITEEVQNLLLPFIFSWAILFGSYFISWWLARKWLPFYFYHQNNRFWYHLMVGNPPILVAFVQLLFLFAISLTGFLILTFIFPKTNPLEALFSIGRFLKLLFPF